MNRGRRAARDLWDLVVMAATIFASIEIPLRLAVDYPAEGWLYLLDWAITLLFTADIVANFMLPRDQGRQLISDRREIARMYLKGWFFVDLLAAVPFDLITHSIGLNVTVEALFVLRSLRLVRILRLARLASVMAKWQSSQIVNPSVLRLAFFIFWVLMLAHWVACGWLGMGGVDGVMLSTNPDGHTKLDTYIRSLYWTITTLTTVGYGDITPGSDNMKLIYTMSVMMLGVGVYGYVIGNMATLLTNIDVARAGHTKRVEAVTAFMKDHDVSPELQLRVQDYFSYLWEAQKGGDSQEILSHLPESLQVELSLQLNRRIIETVPLFEGASESFIRDLVSHLRARIYTPGDYVVRYGEVGSEMFFIHKGRVEVVHRDDETVFATLKEGDFFGEMSLLMKEPRTANIRAIDYCEVYTIDGVTFDRVLHHFPEFEQQIRAAVALRRPTHESMAALKIKKSETDEDV